MTQLESIAGDAHLRPTKRRRIVASTQEEDTDTPHLVRRHPLGVRPSGNALTSDYNLKISCGRFALLPDELLMHFLETLQVPHLLRLGSTCRALHAFTRSEELWKALFIESAPSSFRWQGTWRSTYLAQFSSQEPHVDCSKLFSDVLHRPFFCAHVSLVPFTSDIPESNAIPRLSNLSPEEFQSDWVNKPFILTSPVKQWPVCRTWTTSHLLERYSDIRFRAESVDWPLRSYVDYMRNNHDESPLYLFDRSFVEKMELSVFSSPNSEADYWPPACFGHDIFSLLGAQRPDHRWLIVGSERSGSTFHVDPNATSAWNAVLRGRKYWIMFPPSRTPPGVYVSEDKSEVTSPLSIVEWLLGFHAEARATPGCREIICEEGEVLYVPSGWFHLVVNLEESIAITQNFVPRARVSAVLKFLRDQKASVSGFGEDVENPYELFVDTLKEWDPMLLDETLLELKETVDSVKKGKWERLTKGDEGEQEEAGGFSFGFGAQDDDEEVP